MTSETESMLQEVSSKSDDGKVFKFGGKGGELKKKSYVTYICHPKLNPRKKFHRNQTIGKCSKIQEKVQGKGGIPKKKNAKVTNAISK